MCYDVCCGDGNGKRQTLMIEAVVEDVGDDDGEYCLEDGGEGGW